MWHLQHTYTAAARQAGKAGVRGGDRRALALGTAPFVREREWHKSQAIAELADGRIRLTLNVCNDQPLHAWILGFGAAAFVVSPVSLAQEIFEQADATRRRYTEKQIGGPRLQMAMRTG